MAVSIVPEVTPIQPVAPWCRAQVRLLKIGVYEKITKKNKKTKQHARGMKEVFLIHQFRGWLF